MKTGITNLPLHWGKAPPWLFERMTKLSREIIRVIVEEYGPEEVLKRLSDPFWFQSLGCVLGYDWHSSGLTTVVCGALKEGLRGTEKDLGIFVCGGKGATSRKTPSEIQEFFENFQFSNLNFQNLVYASKMSAKVDNTALQDDYQLYHHTFIFINPGGVSEANVMPGWAVIQQGMNPQNRMARRYHWLSSEVSDFVEEPHSAICCDKKGETLNLVAKESKETRNLSTELVRDGFPTLVKDLERLKTLNMPLNFNFSYLEKITRQAHESLPQNFEGLLGIKGVGPKTIRALSLISELIYNTKPSYKDPARFSFAHGGKDGIPYFVNRKTYDQSISLLERAVSRAKIERSEKNLALKRLFHY